MRRRGSDRYLLAVVRRDKPAIEHKGVLGRGEHRTAIEQCRAGAEAEADALDQGRQVPGVDRLAIDGGLAADCVEPGAPRPGGGERVTRQGRIEAGDGAGGMLDRGADRHRQGRQTRLSDGIHQHDRGSGASNTRLIK
jgi:hypothetical protein